MSESTAKPYLVRALYEWCTAQGFTPYLAVKVDKRTRVPTAYVRNGEITLNISESATQKLTMDNEWVLFSARFNGASQEVAVPMSAVMGIYARETGYGMGFTIAPPAVAATEVAQLELDSETSNRDAIEPEGTVVPVTDAPASSDANAAEEKANRSRSHLSVVK
jgi:stringent starvation protein B